jgi:hypothetical protein
MVMVVRLASPVTIPIWQPLAGLILVVIFTWFTIWVGARVFRTAILIQGQKPTMKTLISYVVRG